ncbi:unnamed protein product, partial [Rotaria sp. Silwood1]
MGIKTSHISKTRELSSDELRVLRMDSKFSEKEIQEWYTGFMQDCPDGKLTRQKLINEYLTFYQEEKAELFCKDGTDDAASLSFYEFLLAISPHAQ